ncbi:MAG: lysoplasmalogenase [Verrucomicrobia bacterium]|nr:lysoplasmalogenase [Verrucomicrobiota bacterium]
MPTRVVLLTIAILGSSAVAIWGHETHSASRWVVYLFKPLSTGLILLLALIAPGPGLARYKWAIVTGLAFSLAGDVFLMLPGNLFLAGLLSFLVAHIAYLVAFTSDVRFGKRPLVFLVWFLVGVPMLLLQWPGIPAALRIPVVLYTIFILAMAGQATSRALSLSVPGAWAAAVGAALFVMSDTMLGLDRFRPGVNLSPTLVLGTYYAAQWLIAMSIRPSRPAS